VEGSGRRRSAISWEQLLDIAREAADLADDERRRAPEACPNDGEPLRRGPSGELYCRFDGYVWSG